MSKKILTIVTAISFAVFLLSCGAQKKTGMAGNTSPTSSSAQQGPTASQWKSGVKGTWVLNSVEREDIPKAYTIKNIFDEAPVECFIGSIWHLPTGNHRGSINFNSAGTLCADGAVRTIVWSIFDPKNGYDQPQFQFKKIYPGEKASTVASGYRMDLSYADEDNLEMRMPIPLDNGEGNLVFKFQRYID